MRILVISGFWPTRSNSISGIFVVQQVQAYKSLGCDVVVIAPQQLRGRRLQRPYHQELDGIDIYSPAYLDVPQKVSGGRLAVSLNNRAYARAVQRAIRRHMGAAAFSGIHLHDLRYASLGYPLWREVRSPRTLLTLHGVDPFIEARAERAWLKSMLDGLWAYVDDVVLVGRPLEQYADKLGVPAGKRTVIHNGSVMPAVWQDTQRSLNEKRVLLSVSNLVPLKGIDLNLKALGAIHRDSPDLDWEYRVIGDGPERSRLEREAAERGISARVSFIGRLDHEDTLAAIAECDVFSLPSWGENFGIVYLEAMGRGRPVIGCRDWGAAEMVRDGVDGCLVTPKDVESLRAAIESLLISPDKCREMGAAARAQAEKFTWAKNAQQHLNMFAAACS